jgi:hypothetical protein
MISLPCRDGLIIPRGKDFVLRGELAGRLLKSARAQDSIQRVRAVMVRARQFPHEIEMS